MAVLIYENEFLEVIEHEASIPWVKIFTKPAQLELSDDEVAAQRLFAAAMVIERAMREFYAPRKINHASFANELPRAHWHVMARFEQDAWWGGNVWQAKQRTESDCRSDWAGFCAFLAMRLDERFAGLN